MKIILLCSILLISELSCFSQAGANLDVNEYDRLLGLCKGGDTSACFRVLKNPPGRTATPVPINQILDKINSIRAISDLIKRDHAFQWYGERKANDIAIKANGDMEKYDDFIVCFPNHP